MGMGKENAGCSNRFGVSSPPLCGEYINYIPLRYPAALRRGSSFKVVRCRGVDFSASSLR